MRVLLDTAGVGMAVVGDTGDGGQHITEKLPDDALVPPNPCLEVGMVEHSENAGRNRHPEVTEWRWLRDDCSAIGAGGGKCTNSTSCTTAHRVRSIHAVCTVHGGHTVHVYPVQLYTLYMKYWP